MRMNMFLGRQDPRQSRDLRPRQFPPDRAGSNRYPRIVAHALHLARIAAGHHVQFVAVFSKPHWRRDLCPVLSERAERDVSLAVDR